MQVHLQKEFPVGEVGGDESKGCRRRFRKAYATKGKGKRSNYVTKILYLILDYPHKHYTFKHFEV